MKSLNLDDRIIFKTVWNESDSSCDKAKVCVGGGGGGGADSWYTDM